MNIQSDLAQRCIELLSFDSEDPKFILDIGCGSGISGAELTEGGHFWVGIDISPDMLGKLF
jgi:18S rRNA (guanine1575-N7)-methyltransferase